MLRDAIVINAGTGNVVYDIDPVPLDDMGGGQIDCGDPNAIALVTAADLAAHDSDDTQEFTVVWADDRSSPVFECPTHDQTGLSSIRSVYITEPCADEESEELICGECWNA